MQKITPFLWFNDNAEEAMKLYTSIFKNSTVKNANHYPEGFPGVLAGKMMTATFELEGTEFMVLNGGPTYQFNESVSFFVKCETQEEVDYYWDALTADGGQEIQCGWLKDKFGLAWQIVPNAMMGFLDHPDREKANRAMQAMMQMKKLDIAALQAAFDGK
ncbi:MAG: hypothetical protein BGO69_03310 [Bacteroidetes bacterium 46-16]|nr:MAG: hypothetical protein BGO69_03310 [Bacteroidetes bacterium 46-16]